MNCFESKPNYVMPWSVKFIKHRESFNKKLTEKANKLALKPKTKKLQIRKHFNPGQMLLV